MKKQTILFLAANPGGTDRIALDREAHAIQAELERSACRDQFELVTRWAVEPLDLLHELRKLKPTVVHFSGHGGRDVAGEHQRGQASPRDVVADLGPDGREQRHGLFFQGPDGRAQFVSTAAITDTFGAAGASVKLVVLNACYTDVQAEALLAHVDWVVGMGGSIHDDAARNFAIGFYGGLGAREPVAAAYQQGRAAISLEGLPDGDRPQLKSRAGVHAGEPIPPDGPPIALPPSPARAGLIDFTAERQRHVGFVGREDVLARLDEWLDAPGETGWVVVTGGPGMGKSAILSTWLARREAAGAVVPHHLVRRQVADWDQPEVIAVSLAAQIEAAYPDLRDPEAKPERRLLELLGRVSKQLGPSGRLVVVVDGLDETRAEAGDNPLPRFLPHVVPAGIRFLCATRATYPHLSWLEVRNPVRRLDLDDSRWSASNEAVVRGFWEVVGPGYEPPLVASMRRAAIARADGNVLHAVMLHDALRDLPASERRVDRIPRGLQGLIGEIWNRAASKSGVRVGLGLLCAAREALSLDVLDELAGWSYDDKECFVRDARQLLLEEPASWAGVDAYRPRHDWVRELIAERLGAATIHTHHRTLSQKLATWPPPTDAMRRSYAIRHVLAHRVATDNWSGVRELASDLGYLEARVNASDLVPVEQELRETAAKCRDRAVVGDLTQVANALARESHWIRADPKGTAGLIWNRLRRAGWRARDLDARLPAESVFLRVRHAASRDGAALDGHTDGVITCTVTPDGRRVISASNDGTLKVWDLEARRVIATLDGHTDGVLACAITPDGRHAISTSADRTLKVWDLDARRVVTTFNGHLDWVRTCAVTPDGRCVISASDDCTLKVWSLDTGRIVATLADHEHWVIGCAMTPDGRHMVSASYDGTLKVWDLDARHVVATLAGHSDGVLACAVTPDGQRVISASDDCTLRVWDLAGCLLATLEGHTAGVRACAVTPDGRRVVSASYDRTLKVWDLDDGRLVATLEGHADGVRGCAVTPDGRRVVSASDDCTLKLWDLDTGVVVATLGGLAAGVRACVVTPDGRRVVSVSDDCTLKLWDLDTGGVITTALHGHAVAVRACAMMPDGRGVVSASVDGTLNRWDLDTGHVVATLDGHASWVRACAVTPDGQRVISGSDDHTLKVWNLKDGSVHTTLNGHTKWLRACAVTPDGRRVVSASDDRTLRVWDLDAGQLLATLDGHSAGVRACAVTPDGRRVVSASDDRTLKVWDLDAGHVLATLDGHTHGVRACAVTPDGRYVVSASIDRTLRLWDLASYSCLLTHRSNAAFKCVAATADVIVAGDGVGTVWFLEWPRELSQARPRSRKAKTPTTEAAVSRRRRRR
jgi:WD40 repeat protein